MKRYGVRASVRMSVRPLVCPSVCLFHSPATAVCGGFAAVGPAGRRYRSIAERPVRRISTAPQHDAQQQMRAAPRLQLT